MPRSFFSRAWSAVKPPPAPRPRRRFNRSQRRLIRGTVLLIALGTGTWAVYAYIASAPDRADEHYRDGMRLLGAGDLEQAAGQFTRVIGIQPQFAPAYLARGKARQAAGQPDAAIADFERAIAINPALELAYTSRGMLLRARGDVDRALADFTRSIHLHPNADAFYQRGLTYQSLNQAQRAIEDYDRAAEYDPTTPYIYRARAKAKRDLGDAAGATQDQTTAEHMEKTQ